MIQAALIITRAETPQPTSPLEDLVRQASCVFVGTVLKHKTVTGASSPEAHRTAVVAVNEVIYKRSGLPDLTDKEIIIELSGIAGQNP
jgi:hypothetical protein